MRLFRNILQIFYRFCKKGFGKFFKNKPLNGNLSRGYQATLKQSGTVSSVILTH